jgi:hypothetical protein
MTFFIITKSIFKIRTGIEEISIDTDEKEPRQVGDEILGYFKKSQPLT